MAPKGPDSPIPQGPPVKELSPEEQDMALLSAVAQRVVKMGLSVPAIFFLESTKPLSFVGSQALVFISPFVKSIFNLATYDRFVSLMEDRANVEKLIQRIEEMDDQARTAEAEHEPSWPSRMFRWFRRS